MKKLLLILLLNFSLLFSPPPVPNTEDPNGRYIQLSAQAGFFWNPDSYGFIIPATTPSKLFEYHAQRQSRPLYILAGTAVGYIFTWITWPLREQLLRIYEKFYRGIYPREMMLYLGNFYLGFLFLNGFILWLALYFFERIFNLLTDPSEYAAACKYILMVFLASNPITKAFFWTVHQQMFAILTPVLCVYLLIWFHRLKKPLSFSGFFLLAVTGGLLLLVYGNFLLLLPCILFCLLQQKFYIRPIRWFNRFAQPAILIFLFFLPTLFWIEILQLKGVEFFSSEIRDYHQFVWIPESLKQSVGSFFYRLLSNSFHYLETMKNLLIFILFSVIVFFAAKGRISIKNFYVIGTAFVFVCFFTFYWLLGYYQPRLTESVLPVVICFWLAVAGQNITGRKVIYILTSLALLWHGYMMLSYGPFE